MSYRSARAALCLLAACAVAACASATGGERSPIPISEPRAQVPDELERLSITLRGRPLTPSESDDLAARALTSRTLYADTLDAWLTREAYRRVMSKWLPYVKEGGVRARRLFLDGFTRSRDPDSGVWVYHLTDATSTPTNPVPPCATSDRAAVAPWWSPREPIVVCKSSYRPEVVFDDVGYCAGQPEPMIPTPRRTACGCGPFLLGCLPPPDVMPGLADRLDAAAQDEIVETATDIAAAGRPLGELLTTSRTWQSGLTAFLYKRRDWLGILARTPYSPEVERDISSQIARVDLTSPPQWVERTGIYAGSGLFATTPYVQAAASQYRSMMRKLLEEVLCVELKGLNVDSSTLLKATAGNHQNLRSLKVHESPMRTTVGCNGCHAPMDNGAAFLVGLRTPLFGSYPSGATASGQLYVNGATDGRGRDEGFAGLSRLLVAQPEFDACVVSHTWTVGMGNAPGMAELPTAERLTMAFRANGRAFPALLRSVLLSDDFRKPRTYNYQ